MDIFSTKYGHESSVFLENERVFFENIWALEQFFFVKYPKKDILFTFLVIMCKFDRIDVFLTKYGHERREFLIKIFDKNDMRAICFCDNGCFFDIIWA